MVVNNSNLLDPAKQKAKSTQSSSKASEQPIKDVRLIVVTFTLFVLYVSYIAIRIALYVSHLAICISRFLLLPWSYLGGGGGSHQFNPVGPSKAESKINAVVVQSVISHLALCISHFLLLPWSYLGGGGGSHQFNPVGPSKEAERQVPSSSRQFFVGVVCAICISIAIRIALYVSHLAICISQFLLLPWSYLGGGGGSHQFNPVEQNWRSHRRKPSRT
jgi:hypothetical protein